MESRNMEELVRPLLDKFDKEEGFCETVYAWYYTTVSDSFRDEVEDCCKVVIFGDSYAMSVQEFYNYDSCLAIESWRNHVSQSLENFHDWANEVIWDDLEDFIREFQQWLAEQDDEWASDVIVALMCGGIDLTKVTYEWLYDRLCREGWDYPA